MPEVLGSVVDGQARCVHYRSVLDVVAIKFYCCRAYYPCHLCHEEHADHAAAPWPPDQREAEAILCGVCRAELSISAYLATDACPCCGAHFNPGCRLHSSLYFAD